jgi:cytochrome c oxidase subunit 1
MYPERLGLLSAALVFVGFNLTFFPQFIMGSHGSPRRWATYPVEFQPFHIASTMGAYLMGIGLFIVLCTWLHGLLRGRPAPANPWGANTLEWQTTSPPPHDNFAVVPKNVGDPYKMDNWERDPNGEGYIRAKNPTPDTEGH